MTELIVKKRKLQPNEFAYSPISTFRYQPLKELFDYIDQNSNLKIIDISDETIGSQICFRVVDKTQDAINEEIEF
jgi:hypothetical protein